MTEAAEPTLPRKRGPNVLAGKSFKLVYNPATMVYDLLFEGVTHQIVFMPPVHVEGLINPLAGGMLHQSGSHVFKLVFHERSLSYVLNQSVDREGDGELATVPSITVKMDSPLAAWIRVLKELTVNKALRLS